MTCILRSPVLALAALTFATVPASAQVRLQNELQIPGQIRIQDAEFGRLADRLQAQDGAIRNNSQAILQLNALQTFRTPIQVDPTRLRNLSDQLATGVIQVRPEADACNLQSELRGITLGKTKDFFSGFEATPCATLKSSIVKQRAVLDRLQVGKLRPVTNDEQQLLDAQPTLAERFPDGFTLAPFAVTTPEGTRFTVLSPDDPNTELNLILKAPLPGREIDLGGPGLVLGVEETETTILYQTIEPIFDEGALTFDPDQIAGAFATGDLNSESCFGNDRGLYFNCFGATVAVEALIDPDAPTTFGSAVLIDAEAGLYLSAFHVSEAHDGVFFTAGGTDTSGQVNARFKMAGGTFEEPVIETFDESYTIQRTGFPLLNAVFEPDYDLIMFRAEPADPDFDPSLLTEARILTTPSDGTLRTRIGAEVVGAGYGGSPDEAGGAEGVRRFSRLAIADCNGDPLCADEKWLVVGERENDLFSEDHAACPNDSGSALFVETQVEVDDAGPIIAVAGILNGRLEPELALAETSVDFCAPRLRYIDLTHPEVQDWLVKSAAILTEQAPEDIRAAYFRDSQVVDDPTFLSVLIDEPTEN